VGRADFLDILRVLNRHQVEFITVGGLAAVFNGAPIVTVDVDILHRRTPENVARLLAALRELGAVYRNDPRNIAPGESHLLGPGHQLLRTKHGDLDVLGTIDDTVVYEDVLDHTIAVELSEIRVLALDLARVIQAKEFAGRPKDLAMLPVLRATLAELKKRDRVGEKQ
jgi:predicted nucleotidyltransferase